MRGGLVRLVAKIVAVDVLVALEAHRNFAPEVEPRVVEIVIVEEREIGISADSSAYRVVHIDDDLDAVFLRAGENDVFEVVEAAADPRDVGGDVRDGLWRAVGHLEAEKRRAPVVERAEIALVHVARGGHDSAQGRQGCDVCRIGDDVVLVDRLADSGRFADGKCRKVEDGGAVGLLNAKRERRACRAEAARIEAERKGYPAVGRAGLLRQGAVDVVVLAAQFVAEGKLELEAFPGIRRAGDAGEPGVDGELERLAGERRHIERGADVARLLRRAGERDRGDITRNGDLVV